MAEIIDQIGLFGLTLIAMLLIVGRGDLRGSFVGLLGQVFWVRSAWRNGLPGIFVLSLIYAAIYAVGCWRWWRGRDR